MEGRGPTRMGEKGCQARWGAGYLVLILAGFLPPHVSVSMLRIGGGAKGAPPTSTREKTMLFAVCGITSGVMCNSTVYQQTLH
jgi:hypothetical protein